jgi:hypothetical protein
MTTNIEITTDYHPMLHGFGLPYRLVGAKKFSLSSICKTYEHGETVISARKQQNYFDVVCKSDTGGWFMSICSEMYMTYPHHIAANIMERYFQKDREVLWLSQFNKLDKAKFARKRLVILDALFFDSSNYHRDRLYEVFASYCNFQDMSIILVGKHSDPFQLASQIGIQPDFGILTK